MLAKKKNPAKYLMNLKYCTIPTPNLSMSLLCVVEQQKCHPVVVEQQASLQE